MFSASCKYAIRATLYLALKTDEKHKIGVSKMSEDLEIPQHFLAKILQRLTKSKLVSSSKGKNGGFFLSKDDKSNKLIQVIEVIDGPDIFDTCVLGLESCSSVNPCPYHKSILVFRNQFYDKLNNESILEVADRIDRESLFLVN